MKNNSKKPILDKLRKRYSIYRKIDGQIQYINLPDDLKKTDFPMLLYDFGRDKIITVDDWSSMYNLSIRM